MTKSSLILTLPLFQYKIGQLYMIAKHSAEESQKGEGVEVVENRSVLVICIFET